MPDFTGAGGVQLITKRSRQYRSGGPLNGDQLDRYRGQRRQRCTDQQTSPDRRARPQNTALVFSSGNGTPSR
jgi:hypothetical protein